MTLTTCFGRALLEHYLVRGCVELELLAVHDHGLDPTSNLLLLLELPLAWRLLLRVVSLLALEPQDLLLVTILHALHAMHIEHGQVLARPAWRFALQLSDSLVGKIRLRGLVSGRQGIQIVLVEFVVRGSAYLLVWGWICGTEALVAVHAIIGWAFVPLTAR